MRGLVPVILGRSKISFTQHLIISVDFAIFLLQDGFCSIIPFGVERQGLNTTLNLGLKVKKLQKIRSKLCNRSDRTFINGFTKLSPKLGPIHALDKLAGIRGDLVRTDPEWESWDFFKLVYALRQWVKRNPVVSNDNSDREENIRKKLFKTRGEDVKVKGCVYCGDADHKAIQCEKIVETSECKKILALCFNCAVKPHRAADCPSKSSCQHCSKRHHSSICDKRPADGKTLMTDGARNDGIFPVVVVKVNGVMCRALIDSGAGSSYASANLVDMFGKNPSEVKSQRIDMLMASKTTRVEIYDAEVSSLDENFKINVKDSKVNKPELLFVKNPSYDQLLRKHDHLRGVTMDDGDTKPQLLIHFVLGNGEYARIKTGT